MPELEISIVLPVHNGAGFIADSLREVTSYLDGLGRPYEVIAVSDGSTDATVEVAEAFEHPAVRVLHYPHNQGKGFALSLGLAQSHGRLIGWIDADLDIAPDFVGRALKLFQEEEIDAVIGSKRHPDSAVVYPPIRRVYSWGFQTIARVFFRLDVRDTQVGAKLFRREMMDTVLPLLLIKRYAFDLEVLAVGAAFGFDRVREAPIALEYRFTGTGVDWTAAWRMLIDTLAIAYRIHVRHHYVRQFAVVQRERSYSMPGAERGVPSVPEMAGVAAAAEEER